MKSKTLLIALLMSGVFIFGLSKAIKDTLQHHYSQSIFTGLDARFWNPSESWKNKYADFDTGSRQPAFPGSTSLLVSLTDAWHLFDLLSIIGLLLAGMAASRLVAVSNRPGRAWWLWGLFTLIAGLAMFHFFYTFVLV